VVAAAAAVALARPEDVAAESISCGPTDANRRTGLATAAGTIYCRATELTKSTVHQIAARKGVYKE
jgi:hypothetical protein